MSEPEIVGLAFISLLSFVMSYYGSTVGLVLGQLRVVLLTYVLGSAALGTATSLAVSTVATIAGTVAHARGGRVSLVLIATIGAPSAIAAYFASRFAAHVNPAMIKILISLVLFVTGGIMLRKRKDAPADVRNSEPDRKRIPEAKILAEQVALGSVLGALSGLVGLLLGTIRLPVMLKIARVEPKTAVGTNMAIGAITGLSGGIAAIAGGRLHLASFSVIAPITLLGAHLGAKRTGEMSGDRLRVWIAYALIVSGLLMGAEATLLSRLASK